MTLSITICSCFLFFFIMKQMFYITKSWRLSILVLCEISFIYLLCSIYSQILAKQNILLLQVYFVSSIFLIIIFFSITYRIERSIAKKDFTETKRSELNDEDKI